ncbi:MAG: hypothetical protein EXR74_09555, partial [Bdellovibrionales bacterium]|nr:hypothetical protein [Bdellovibrionales bacterium]
MQSNNPEVTDAMKWLSLLFLLSFIFTSAYASPRFTKCGSLLRAITAPLEESSVELELRNSNTILSLLTTTTGTLAPLLPKKITDSFTGLDLPSNLQSQFQGWSYDRLAAEPWDNLTPFQKRVFLQWVSSLKPTPFFKDRTVPGIKLKDSAQVHFSTPTQFLEVSYPAGDHEIDISKIFRKVEYASPSQDPNFLELHFRTRKSAGEVSNSAATFLSGLKEPKIHQHVHIVSPLPIEKLQKDGMVRSAMIVDLYRRANLISEMLTIVEERGHGLTSNRSANIVFWDTLSPRQLNIVFQHLEKTRVLGQASPLGSQAKMAYVGFRGGDTYDDPSLFGFEVRGISKSADTQIIKNFLNTLQWAMKQEDYGVPKQQMEEWISKQPHSFYLDMGKTWYQQPWEILKANGFGHRYEEIDSYLRKHF